MKFSKRWWWGINSTWAKFCKRIGKYPQWVHQDMVGGFVCCESGKLVTKACIDAGKAAFREFKELNVPTEKCPLDHIVWIYAMACMETDKRPTIWCPGTYEGKMTQKEYGPWSEIYCDVHVKPVPPPPPPPEKHILPMEYKFPINRKLVCPVLIPGIGLVKLIKEKQLEAFADRIAEEKLGNAIRMFSTAGWEPHFFNDKVVFPYIKRSGKFDLESFNPRHMEFLKRRIAYFTERGITVILTMLDNCQLHTDQPGYWNMNWWNGKNNINGTSKWKPAMTHWYEPEHQNKAGVKKMGEYLMRYYRHLWENLDNKFRPFIVWECGNEIDARMGYHQMMRKFIVDEYGVPKHRRITSMYHASFYLSSVHQDWNYSLHGCEDFDSYKERKSRLVPRNVNVLASNDGPYPPTSLKVTEDFVYKTLKDGALGCELNFRPYFKRLLGGWVKAGGNEDWNLMNLNWDFLRAVGKGFRRYVEGR